MRTPSSPSMMSTATRHNVNTLGFYAAILTTIVTVLTFAMGIFTPPLAGPFCQGSCFEYPYTGIASRFPRDYGWMYPAILLPFIYYVLIACIHHYAAPEKKVFSHIGLSFALLSAGVLIVDYFVQVSIIQPSLLNGETEGIALFTQFNSHGLFIVLEDIAYITLSVAFLFLAPVFSGSDRLERTIRWVFILGFVLTMIALVFISIQFGIFREYRFEVAAISITWLVLIVSGILLSVLFRREMRTSS